MKGAKEKGVGQSVTLCPLTGNNAVNTPQNCQWDAGSTNELLLRELDVVELGGSQSN